jgi:hypothetical protein
MMLCFGAAGSVSSMQDFRKLLSASSPRPRGRSVSGRRLIRDPVYRELIDRIAQIRRVLYSLRKKVLGHLTENYN